MRDKKFMNQKLSELTQEELVKALLIKIHQDNNPKLVKPQAWKDITKECEVAIVFKEYSGFFRIVLIHKKERLGNFPHKYDNGIYIYDSVKNQYRIEYNNIKDFKILKKQ